MVDIPRKAKITLEVDTVRLFETCSQMGVAIPQANLLTLCQMGGEKCFREEIGLAFYGIEVIHDGGS